MFILPNVYVPFDVNQYTNRVAIDKLDLNGTKKSFFLIFNREMCCGHLLEASHRDAFNECP